MAITLRNGRPGKHGGVRRRHIPASGPEAVDQDVAAGAIEIAHLVNAILRAVQRGGCRDLHRRECTVVKI